VFRPPWGAFLIPPAMRVVDDSLTAKGKHPDPAWYQQPLAFGVIVLAACVLLNILFWRAPMICRAGK